MQLNDSTLQLTTPVVPQDYLDVFTGTWNYIHGPQTNLDRAENHKPGAVAWSTAKFKKKDGTEVPGKLTEDIIRKAIKKGGEAVGTRFKKSTQYLLIDIDRYSPYHPWESSKRFNELLATLEKIGLVRPLLVRSSASNGLHVYFPLPEAVRSWSTAKRLHDLLTAGGFKVQDGWLELFPNPKRDKTALYDGHRLPLILPDSLVVDGDLNPITGDRAAFMQMWRICAACNETEYFATENRAPLAYLNLAPAQTNPAPRPIKRVSQPQQPAPAPVTTGAPATGKRGRRPLPAWTGPHCSNQVMRELANYGYEVLRLQTVSALADWMKKTAVTLPGYQEWASPDARRDIENWDWCERWAKSRIKKESGVFDCAGHDLNAERAADAKARLTKLVEMLAGKTFATVRSLFETLIELGKDTFGKGFSNGTLLKYKGMLAHLLTPEASEVKAETAADAQARLGTLVERLEKEGKTFPTIRSLFSALTEFGREQFGKGFGGNTLLKYKDLLKHLVSTEALEANKAQPTPHTVDQRERSVTAQRAGASQGYTHTPDPEKPAPVNQAPVSPELGAYWQEVARRQEQGPTWSQTIRRVLAPKPRKRGESYA